MECSNFSFINTIVVSVATLLLYSVLRITYVVWWRPKSLEWYLRRQGIKGTSYKLFHGDTKELVMSSKEAWSKPMTQITHHIVPRVIPFVYQMVENYGKISMSWKETRASIIVADTELMKLVLENKNGHFVKPPLNPLVDLLQLGVSTLEGEKWAKRRRLITPAFHLEKLKEMIPAFATSCCNLVERWTELVSLEGSCEWDVAPEFHNLAGDVIARTAFGSSYEEGKKIFELQKEQAVLVLEAYYSFYVPGFRFIPTRKNKRRYDIDKEIKTTLRDMIHKKEQAIKNGEFKDNDLLGLLLQCKEQSGNEMTVEDVIEECKLFYFAGQETTANWLTWTLITLSMYPNWQEKARQEVLQICGKKIPSAENMNHLKVVSMILYEVLRLYPPVTVLPRHTSKKTSIGGMPIPAGVDIQLPTLLLHYEPEYWGDDAEEFRPERFAEGVSKASKDQIAFYPFGWGPRFCLGQNFAMIEAKMALAMILQRFWFELSPSYMHAPYQVITLQPQHGAPVILHQI
ncbi:cytochrome P450 CYP72A219-like isoform X2 [Durio zibethinus]|uniref:Cytochrome P450 CYP72A219-like isoform X2 n=1 Tax=Durio zibethinus TaxID=66656 RepID=A0A6P6A869_DURZI|nr:cytochrome P450 CYP72A219-like isoform X2 [Durio zibethinus]